MMICPRALRLVLIALPMVWLAGSSHAAAQITVGSVTTPADVVQPVAGACTNYNSVLAATGVQTNGQPHPGTCRQTAFTPLFNGSPLGTDMQAFFSSVRPALYTLRLKRRGSRFCATASALNVALSASVQVTRLEWTGAPAVGPVCSGEVTRVNGARSVARSTVQSSATRAMQGAANQLLALPAQTACGVTQRNAVSALQQQVWDHLQSVAAAEQLRFALAAGTFRRPRRGEPPNPCPAKCNLCFQGWVGSIACKATADSFGYKWNETQIWDVGGPSTSGAAGSRIYPARFTASGSGSKQNGPSWRISVAATGSLTDAGVNANKRFSTSNATHAGGITWTQSTQTSADGEMQVKFNADQVGGSTATHDPTATIPACINAQQKPANVSCTVACNWNLTKQ